MPSADILLNGGDFTNVGTLKDVKSYDKWIGDLIKVQKKYKYCVLIAGNHDITLEEDYYNEVGYKRFHHGKKQNFQECINIARNGNNVYLLDETVELFGVKMYGRYVGYILQQIYTFKFVCTIQSLSTRILSMGI